LFYKKRTNLIEKNLLILIGQDVDDEELERELEELEQEELDKDLLGVGGVTEDLPEVPQDELKDKAKEKKKGMFIEK